MSLILKITSIIVIIASSFLIPSALTETTLAETTTSYPFKKCTVSSTSIAPGKEVFLEIETDPFKLEATVNVVNNDTNNSIKRISIKEESKKTIRTISLGTFTDPASYSIQVYQDTQSRQRCNIHPAFSVITQYTGACPKFLSYSDTKFQKDTAIYAYFDSLPSPPPFYFAIHVDNNAHIDPLQDVKPPVGPPVGGDWRGFIGLLSEGNHTARLLYSPKQTLSEASLCYELPKITVGQTSGQNPCGPEGKECPTALGNIPTNPKAFAEKVLQIGYGLGGGIAFILMVIGSIRVLTSSGDQQKLSAGRDMIVAAVAGLLFIIFSVLILQFIGIEIIGLSP